MDSNDIRQKKCSYCGEEISYDLRRCPYCSSLLKVEVDGLDVQAPERGHEIDDHAPTDDAPEMEAPVVGSTKPLISVPASGKTHIKPLSNGLKVFLAVLVSIVPGFGQLAGIIMSIIFINSDDDPDRKSFGVALLVASLVMFVISCISSFILIIAFAAVVGFGSTY